MLKMRVFYCLEHFIQELIACIGYSDSEDSLSYWRTSGGVEVDVILGNARVIL
jgi:hypothetical protein